MTTIEIGKIFTGAELRKAKKLYKTAATGTFAKLADEQIVKPVLARINRVTNQENDSRYLAYALEYVIMKTEGDIDA